MDPAERDKIVREHLEVVERIVGGMLKRLGPSAERDEIRAMALSGLAEAIDRYEPDRGASFRTFAEPRIRGAIYDGLDRAEWFPRRLRRKIAFYRRADDLLRARSEEPAPADRAEAVHRLAGNRRELATAYVTTYAAEAEPASCPAEAEFTVERKRYVKRLALYVSALPPKQQAVVRAYFFEERSLPDIAAELGYSKSWTSRLLSAALNSLRCAFDEAPLSKEDYGGGLG